MRLQFLIAIFTKLLPDFRQKLHRTFVKRKLTMFSFLKWGEQNSKGDEIKSFFPIEIIPADILNIILSYLRNRDFFNFGIICKHVYKHFQKATSRTQNFFNVKAETSGMSPIMCHNTIIKHDSLFLFFGDSPKLTANFGNITHEIRRFDFDSKTWTYFPIDGVNLALTEAASTCDQNGNVIIFGGVKPGSERSNELYQLHFEKTHAKFSELKCYSNDVPPRGSCCGIGIFENMIYVISGWNPEVKSSNLLVFCYDIANFSWTKIDLTNSPEYRRAYKTVVYKEFIYLFGGLKNQSELEYTNELWRFNMKTLVWEFVNVRGDIPTPRNRVALVVHNDKIYMHGGEKHVTFFVIF
jgi:N-acetylneuraminic acid mutarotase